MTTAGASVATAVTKFLVHGEDADHFAFTDEKDTHITRVAISTVQKCLQCMQRALRCEEIPNLTVWLEFAIPSL